MEEIIKKDRIEKKTKEEYELKLKQERYINTLWAKIIISIVFIICAVIVIKVCGC